MWKQAPEQACVERRRTSARSTKAPTSSRCPALAECQRSPKPDSRWKKYSNPCRHVEAPLHPHFNDNRWKKYSNPCRHVEAPLPPISMLSRDRLGHGCSRGSIISSTRPTSPRDLSNIAVGGKGGTRSSRVRIFLPSTVPVVGASVDA